LSISGERLTPRVLFISATLGVGGAERQWAVLIPRLRERGFAPLVLTLLGTGPFYEDLAQQNIPMRFAAMNSRIDLGGIARAFAVGRGGYDLIVSQSFAGQAVAEGIARVARVPHMTAEHQPPDLPRRGHERVMLTHLAPLIEAVVAVTRAQIPDLVDVGYRHSRIRVIPNGIADLVAQQAPTVVRCGLGLEEGQFVAVLAARMHPQKQAELFVDAVARASESEPRIRGIVAGTGPELPRVEAAAARTHGIVRVLGHRADAIDLLAMADVVCLSSFAEGLPMVVLEAMALGKPIVATDVGGIADAVVPDQTGFLVASGDVDQFARALVVLARNPRLAAELGRRAQERQIAYFSADAMADKYALLFESLISASQAHARKRRRGG
jgi:glycosyltransferase involved in cell wall biosynthesis